MSTRSLNSEAAFTEITGAVTAPTGFRASGVACGIKKNGKPDLAIILSDTPAASAAVFTLNKAQAAPVLVSKERLAASGGRSRVVVINSGCANACTGPEGVRTAELMADAAAGAAFVDPSEVLVASTGVIGVALDRERVTAGIASAVTTLSSSSRS